MSNEAVLAGLNGRLRKLIESESGNEPIMAVVPGRESQAVALTRRHVISAQGSLILRAVETVRVSDIVNISSGLTALRIELTNGSSYELPIWPTQMENAKEFVRKVRAVQDSASGPVGVSSSAGGVADELTKLAQLRDQGVLTEPEFQAQKANLLARGAL